MTKYRQQEQQLYQLIGLLVHMPQTKTVYSCTVIIHPNHYKVFSESYNETIFLYMMQHDSTLNYAS